MTSTPVPSKDISRSDATVAQSTTEAIRCIERYAAERELRDARVTAARLRVEVAGLLRRLDRLDPDATVIALPQLRRPEPDPDATVVALPQVRRSEPAPAPQPHRSPHRKPHRSRRPRRARPPGADPRRSVRPHRRRGRRTSSGTRPHRRPVHSSRCPSGGLPQPAVVRPAPFAEPAPPAVAPAPETAAPKGLEAGYAEVLAEVLGVPSVPATSNFFDDLGADSMVMARFCAKVRTRQDLPNVAIKDIYRAPTVAALAAARRRQGHGGRRRDGCAGRPGHGGRARAAGTGPLRPGPGDGADRSRGAQPGRAADRADRPRRHAELPALRHAAAAVPARLPRALRLRLRHRRGVGPHRRHPARHLRAFRRGRRRDCSSAPRCCRSWPSGCWSAAGRRPSSPSGACATTGSGWSRH